MFINSLKHCNAVVTFEKIGRGVSVSGRSTLPPDFYKLSEDHRYQTLRKEMITDINIDRSTIFSWNYS